MPLAAGCLEALLQPRRGRGLAEERKGAGFPAGGHMASSPARDENAVGRGSYPSGRGPRPDWLVPWPVIAATSSLPSPAPRFLAQSRSPCVRSDEDIRQAGGATPPQTARAEPTWRPAAPSYPPTMRQERPGAGPGAARRGTWSGPARDLERPGAGPGAARGAGPGAVRGAGPERPGARWNPGAWHRPAREPGHRCAMRPAAPAFFWGGGPQTRKERGGGPRTQNVPAPSRRRKRILRHKRRNPVRLRDAAPPGTGPKSLTGASPDPTLCGGGGTGWPRPPRRAGCSRRRALPGLGGAEML
jgi:hypothetical protein